MVWDVMVCDLDLVGIVWDDSDLIGIVWDGLEPVGIG